MSRGIRPARTVGATLLGGLVGMIILGAVGIVIGRQLDLEGLATLLPVLWSAIVGILVGSAVALAIAFRDEPTERRAVTVAVVLVPGALLFTGALVDVVDVTVVHPLTLAVLLPVLAAPRVIHHHPRDRRDRRHLSRSHRRAPTAGVQRR